RDSPMFADTRLSGESDGRLILTELRSSGVSCACKASSVAAQSTVIRLFHLLNIYGINRHVAVGPVYETSSYGPLRACRVRHVDVRAVLEQEGLIAIARFDTVARGLQGDARRFFRL